MRFINCGFGNLVAAERIVSAATPDAAPIKRLIQDAKESCRAVDLCCGKRCRTVLILDSGHVVLCALTIETIGGRLAGEDSAEKEENDE
ncbi:MAG: DUF370 domain-containing protein [Ruminococcaceae bacterium]|nr:DUF370 domain-containing protein [Oscillospiraceae bacterium]